MLEKLNRAFLYFISVILFICAGLYIFITTKPPVKIAQDLQTSGKIAPLTHGNTYYEVYGPQNGEPVVFIHGSIVPSNAFDKNFYLLGEKGFRVIRLDLYGRGLSSRPKISYTMDIYVDQIHELLDYLNIKTKINIAGASMGGALVTLFAEKYPNKVKKAILLDPVTPTSFNSDGKKFFKRIKNRIENLIDRLSDKETTQDSAPFKLAAHQFKYEGVGRTIFSAVSNLRSIDLSHSYTNMNNLNIPVLLIWGTEDDVIPISESKTVIKFINNLEYHPIDSAGHMPHYEKPDIVNPILINFLKNSNS